MHQAVVMFIVVGLACALLGYAFRGAIDKHLGLAKADAELLAARLEKAVIAGGAKLEQEARTIASDIRAKLSKL